MVMLSGAAVSPLFHTPVSFEKSGAASSETADMSDSYESAAVSTASALTGKITDVSAGVQHNISAIVAITSFLFI